MEVVSIEGAGRLIPHGDFPVEWAASSDSSVAFPVEWAGPAISHPTGQTSNFPLESVELNKQSPAKSAKNHEIITKTAARLLSGVWKGSKAASLYLASTGWNATRAITSPARDGYMFVKGATTTDGKALKQFLYETGNRDWLIHKFLRVWGDDDHNGFRASMGGLIFGKYTATRIAVKGAVAASISVATHLPKQNHQTMPVETEIQSRALMSMRKISATARISVNASKAQADVTVKNLPANQGYATQLAVDVAAQMLAWKKEIKEVRGSIRTDQKALHYKYSSTTSPIYSGQTPLALQLAKSLMDKHQLKAIKIEIKRTKDGKIEAKISHAKDRHGDSNGSLYQELEAYLKKVSPVPLEILSR